MKNPKKLLRVSIVGTTGGALLFYTGAGGLARCGGIGGVDRLSGLRIAASSGILHWTDHLCGLA